MGRGRAHLATAGALLLVTLPAQAADLRPAPAYKAPPSAVTVAAPTWAGSYAGLFAGYAWGRANATAAYDSDTTFFYNWTGAPYSFDAGGFFGGATLGHNWQRGGLVFGLEGEIGYLGLSGSGLDPNAEPGEPYIPDTESRLSTDFYAALYARAGVALGQALVYVKGGGAILNARASTVDDCVNDPPGGGPPCGTATLDMQGNRLMTGWSVGAGAEWMLSPRSTLKAEYAWFDFGRIHTAGPSSADGEFYRQSIAVQAHTVKLGWNYRFGAAPVMARY